MKTKFVPFIVFALCAASAASQAATIRQKSRSSSHRTRTAADPDRLGLTCPEILDISSDDWVAKYRNEKEASTPRTKEGVDGATIRALAAYGKCYDARTDHLAYRLGRSGKGPLMGARGNFGDFENAVKSFTALALRDSQPPGDAVKSAYAALYQKQFRYEFYESYEPHPVKPAVDAPPAPAAATSAPAKSSSAKPAATSPSSHLAASTSAAAPAAGAAPPGNTSDFSKAKNHFGVLLGALPFDQMHQLHESFGQILGANQVSEDTRLAVYRYAIFLLEPATAKPFAPPPF